MCNSDAGSFAQGCGKFGYREIKERLFGFDSTLKRVIPFEHDVTVCGVRR